MGLASAAALIATASFKNRVLRQLRRLRQPKYLIPTIVGLAYFFSLFGRRLLVSSARVHVEEAGPALIFVEVFLLVAGLLLIAGAWVFGKDDATLQFSEAEIQWLFPAPVSRRALLHYRLVMTTLRTFLGAILTTLIFGRSMTGHPVLFTLGFWLALSVMSMHATAASLTRASLAEQGLLGFRRRALSVVALLAVVGLAAWVAVDTVPPPPPEALSGDSVAAWVGQVLDARPLAYLLAPARALTGLILAQDGGAFLRRLPWALLLFALHYLWVLSSKASFEDGAVEWAARRAARLEARRSGRRGLTVTGARKPPFTLRAHGRPEVAFLWKNVIASRRLLGLRLLPPLLAVGAVVGLMGFSALRHSPSGYAAAVGLVCLGVWGLLVLLGPTMFRADLRVDLPNIDILRAWPLSGAQVVRGEVAGVAVVLTLLQWALLAAAVLLSAFYVEPTFPLLERVEAALACALLGPPFTVLGLVVQNGAVLLFPGWISPDLQKTRGFEVVGQRMLTLAGTLLVVVVGVLPAAAVGAGVGALLYLVIGAHALPFAAAAGAAVMLVEAHLATLALGGLFDRFDVTS